MKKVVVFVSDNSMTNVKKMGGGRDTYIYEVRKNGLALIITHIPFLSFFFSLYPLVAPEIRQE